MKVNKNMKINVVFLVLAAVFVVVCSAVSKENGSENQTSNTSHSLENSVKIDQYPESLIQNSLLDISYACSNDSHVLVRVQIKALTKQQVSIFKRSIRCTSFSTPSHNRLIIRLPKRISYSPSSTNKYRNFPTQALIRAWIVPVKNKWMTYSLSQAKDEVVVRVPLPFERPPMPEVECLVWWKRFVRDLPYSLVCPFELETIKVLSYPLALSGERVGLVKKLDAYSDLALLAEYRKEMDNASFTFIMWVFIVDYCPNSLLCSIMHHSSWDEKHYSPLVLINRKGQLHIEVFRRNRTSTAFLSFSSLAKNQWTLLVISCRNSKEIRIDVGYAPRFETKLFLTINLPEGVFFKDSMGNMIFGGSDMHPSFKGYFGDVVLHRRRLVSADQVQLPPRSHPMFQLKLQEIDSKCASYNKKVSFYWKGLAEKYKFWKTWRRMCKASKNEFTELFSIPKPIFPQCSIFHNPSFRRQYTFVANYIKKLIPKTSRRNTEELSSILIDEVYSLIENKGLAQMPTIISFLKQSSCLHNHDASYILASIYNYGLTVPVNELQAHSYLLRSCLNLNRLSLLSMANKHTLGIDGIPLDYEQAYVYYMTATLYTLKDLRSHRDKDSVTELVRLTDEKRVEEQQGEDGHLYHWFKQQAFRGMLGAQRRMASLLYWGAKGVKRNMTKASNYYQQAAETGNPGSVHDYAVILLKGHGVKQNVSRAVELLQEGASKNYSRSCNTLGWYYLVHERNYTLAAHYLEKAFQLGDPDAGHNLAHMLLTSKYPGVNRVEHRMAWEFASKAAMRGNFDSGILVAKYNMLGHVKIIRDPHLSVVWARHLSEKSPSVARLLSSGVRTYRLKNWQASLLYYLLAADSGTEVASFNLAYLCEENHEYLSSNMQKECAYRHYNFSTLRSNKKTNSYAWLKMADFFYQLDNITMATKSYADAAVNGDPQGLFSLGLLVEEGVRVSDEIWKSLDVPFNTSRHRLSLLDHIYTRCMHSHRQDAYLPCFLALSRVRIEAWCLRYQALILTSLMAMLVMVVILPLTRWLRHGRSLEGDFI